MDSFGNYNYGGYRDDDAASCSENVGIGGEEVAGQLHRISAVNSTGGGGGGGGGHERAPTPLLANGDMMGGSGGAVMGGGGPRNHEDPMFENDNHGTGVAKGEGADGGNNKNLVDDGAIQADGTSLGGSNAVDSNATTQMLEQEYERICSESQAGIGRLFQQLASYDELARNVLQTWNNVAESEMNEAMKLDGVERDVGHFPSLMIPPSSQQQQASNDGEEKGNAGTYGDADGSNPLAAMSSAHVAAAVVNAATEMMS